MPLLRGAGIVSAIVVLLATPVFASETSGTVASATYAWGENLGWVNFGPVVGGTYEGLTVTDTKIGGYAWSANAGWINFDAEGGGVTNTSSGVLGGNAWSTALGWISMSGVTIDSSGVFHGIAGVSGSPTGRISFDCDHCKVSTDWRPASARVATSSPLSIANGSPAPSLPTRQNPQLHPTAPPSPASSNPPSQSASEGIAPISNTSADPIKDFYTALHMSVPTIRNDPRHTESYNEPLSISAEQPGLLVYDFGRGRGVAVEVPAGIATNDIHISISLHAVASGAYGTIVVVVGDAVFDIIATDLHGTPVHLFKKPLKITLAIPEQLQGENVGVYWYDVNARNWIAIPGVVFTATTATFSVDHLTRFGILREQVQGQAAAATSTVPTNDLTSLYLISALLLAALVLLLVFRKRRRL